MVSASLRFLAWLILLMMEATSSSETSVVFQPATRCIPESEPEPEPDPEPELLPVRFMFGRRGVAIATTAFTSINYNKLYVVRERQASREAAIKCPFFSSPPLWQTARYCVETSHCTFLSHSPVSFIAPVVTESCGVQAVRLIKCR